MLVFLLRRLVSVVPVLFGVSVVVFLMLHLVPGDPAVMIAGTEASAEDVASIRHSLGLDQSLAVQYAHFVARAITGDFGTSFRTHGPAMAEIGYRYLNTLLLAGSAVAFSLLLGVVSGTLAGVARGRGTQALAMLVSLLGVSVPNFFLGLLLMLVFSVYLGWLPLTGSGGLSHLVLPTVTLGLANAAVISRMTRSSLMEAMGQDYVRTARAKGVAEGRVVVRHALRNSVLPVITVAGLEAGALLGGAVVTETVFA